ncbi:MAG: M20/M25/M40 family metallo-hydrolase [Candidatus Nanoarchaeia archaeon]|jgi:acetylornithine deacetylase/succinyl-diaminopimelate desuccinylase-like protein
MAEEKLLLSAPKAEQQKEAAKAPVEAEIHREAAKLPEKIEKVFASIEKNFPKHIAKVQEFLKQSSVANEKDGIIETALMVKGMIESIGGKASFHGSDDFPIVMGQLDLGKPKTLLIYGMYDVQPADEKTWKSPPFSAEIRETSQQGKCIFARGAVNSKGSLASLFNALKEMKANDEIPVNLKFTIEGEEEIGSPHFAAFVEKHKDELKADACVDFDFAQDTDKKVTMQLGVKGIITFDIVCKGGRVGGPAEKEVHSSDSAWISSPAWRMVQFLSTLVDKKEKVLIDGFYDNVIPPSKEDVELLDKLAKTFDENSVLREIKSLRFKYDTHGADLLQKYLYLPTLNITGVSSGYTGPGQKSVLPSKARAKMEIRLVPNQKHEEILDKFRKHIVKHGFDDITMEDVFAYPWSKTPVSSRIVHEMIDAYRILGHEPEIWPLGAWSAPYYVFSNVLNLPFVRGGLGCGDNEHSANEYCTVDGIKDFEKFVVVFLNEFAGKK